MGGALNPVWNSGSIRNFYPNFAATHVHLDVFINHKPLTIITWQAESRIANRESRIANCLLPIANCRASAPLAALLPSVVAGVSPAA
jgi:hypothetical protein